MNTRTFSTALFIGAILLTACGDTANRGVATADDPLGGSPIVARYENGLIAVDRERLTNNVITIPLSFFTEEMQFLQLDDADEALVAPTGVTISDNYILVHAHSRTHTPFKLFERATGRFITNIGAFGQGPNEYSNVYHQQLDEANNRIFLLPWQADRILVFDLQGNALDPIRLLGLRVPKGKFHVDTQAGTVTVVTLPFTGMPAVVWQQTLDGQRIQYVPPRHLAVPPDFSNEVYGRTFDGNFDFQIFTFVPRADTLFRFNPVANELQPLFTLDFGRRDLNIHSYGQTAGFFMGQISEPEQIAEHLTTTTNHRFFIVDRQALRGSFFRVENDFFGNAEVGWPSFALNGKYFARNADPGDLLYELENMLSSDNDFSPEKRTRLTELKNSISENDNNWIMFARMRR